MAIMSRIRIYHAFLAVLSILAYMTGELGIVHAWLGYGVATVIAFRLLWALSGERQVGLMRFYPSFDGLNLGNAVTHPAITKIFMLGIALSLLAVTTTGIAMDRGKAVGLANASLSTLAYADSDGHEKNRGDESALSEVHEFFANFLMLFVGLHVTYLLLFKRTLAKFMLFVPNQVNKKGR
ncbi:MAG: cytochrome b/b6 domain-containing protein [Parvibaculum sp.]|nr:cytochrome b/b6 domain-containing protein [Parvibaculum sp.]